MTATFYKFSDGNYFATVELMEAGAGYTSEWWVSTRENDSPQVLAYMSIPVYGPDLNAAGYRASVIAHDVVNFVKTSAGGLASPQGRPEDPRHATQHLRAHSEYLIERKLDSVSLTVAQYELLAGFKVANPAKMIAEYQNVKSVRTIHDRLARARKLGLLESYGKGKSYA